MKDIDIAKEALNSHSLALCRDGKLITSDKRGVSALLELIDGGNDLRGYSAADIIVGKAAAMLFVKLGIKELYAKTLSAAGEKYLKEHGIVFTYGEKCENIINRDKTDICPMEKSVIDTDDFNEGYVRIKNRLNELRKAK